jgi:hypothetical protein
MSESEKRLIKVLAVMAAMGDLCTELVPFLGGVGCAPAPTEVRP